MDETKTASSPSSSSLHIRVLLLFYFMSSVTGGWRRRESFIFPCRPGTYRSVQAVPETSIITGSERRGEKKGREGGPNATAVLIIPGYATDWLVYDGLCNSLQRRGYSTFIIPIKWYHWISTFGGRSIRPILDRIHEAVLQVYSGGAPSPPPYTLLDFMQELRDPSQGARPHRFFPPSDSTDTKAAGGGGTTTSNSAVRLALIGHSAGGWVARVYLSTAEYDGQVYNGSRFCNRLVTLGTPHLYPSSSDLNSHDKPVPYALRNLKYVNEWCTGDKGGNWEGTKVKCICVGGDSVQGQAFLGGLMKDMVAQSYELCGAVRGEAVTGDGITPLDSALALPKAQQVVIKGVYHGPEEHEGKLWYGSEACLDQWVASLGPPS